MDAAPVIARGHNVAVFVPPVTEAALAVLEAGGKRPALILTSDSQRAADLADGLSGAFAVTGLERARLVLADKPPAILVSGAGEALALLTRSALHPATFACIVLAWPEQQDDEGDAALASVMAECDKEAQRIVLTARTGAATEALIERYAFKAMTFGFPAQEAPAESPLGPARFVIGAPSRAVELRRRVLDSLHGGHEEQIVVAPCPRSRASAAELVASAPAGEAPIIVAQPHQIAWLRTLFAPLSSLHLPGSADLAETRAEKLRARIARTIETEDLDRELLIVGPLLGQFDPATVAAAAIRLGARDAGAPGRAASGATAAPSTGMAAIAKVWVGIGRKDNVKPGDLVGAIVNEAGVPAEAIGKIEVKDLFCLVEIRAEVAEQVVKGLTGKSVRGRRLVARLDRGPGAKPPRRA
ncbi:MAG: DbpA RNA binding domain-containing protein [Gemmatimonadales bacterium]